MKNASEPWSFAIKKGKIELFLKDKNLSLIQNLNSEDLEKEFFKDENGSTIGKVNGTHCTAYARKL